MIVQTKKFFVYSSAFLASTICLKLLLNKFSTHSKTQQRIPFQKLLQKYSTQFNESKFIQKIIPRKFQTTQHLINVTSNLYYTSNQYNTNLQSLTKSISQPVWDLMDRGGKRWRAVLCMLIAEMFNLKRTQVYDLAAITQIVHNGTLIIDDIQDNSDTRRNKKCVHLIYGVDISLNAGNFMYFAPFNYILKQKKYNQSQRIRMSQIFLQQMTNLHIGQGWDISWHNIQHLKVPYPNQKQYLQMTAHKTGVLARLSVRMACVALNLNQQTSKVISRLAETMGVAFQIQDDLLNLQGEDYIKTKGYSGQDIHEGKLTLMVLHSIQSAEKNDRNKLLEILFMKTTDKQLIQKAIRIMKKTGSLEYARKRMEQLIENAWSEAQIWFPQNIYKGYLKQLAYFNIKRKI